MNTTCRIITYTLRDESGTSNGYFETIATFADGILSLFESALKPMITDFQHYLISRDDLPRSQPEYIFELLTLGVLWRVHAPLNTPRTLKGLEALIAHLALVGEFTQEVAHLQAWHGYLNTLSPSIVSQTLTRVIACAMEFEERAKTHWDDTPRTSNNSCPTSGRSMKTVRTQLCVGVSALNTT